MREALTLVVIALLIVAGLLAYELRGKLLKR
jgi:hypothetical protein